MNKAEEMRNLVKSSIEQDIEDEYNKILKKIHERALLQNYSITCSYSYEKNIDRLEKDGFKVTKNRSQNAIKIDWWS